jgi:glycosyltransferase involved in cell wall biosynthesis
MLRGTHGPDAKEFARLVEWLAGEMRPDVVDLSNSLLLGLAEPLRQRLGRPVVCTLSGEDVFLEGLGEPWRTECLELLQQHAVHANAFITFSRYYAGFMAEYLKIPDAKLHCVPLGISLEGHGQESGVRGQDSGVGCAGSGAKSDAEHPEQQSGERQAAGELVLGYLARICPEKGLHLLCEAFRLLREQPKYARTKLRVAGYLGQRDRPYWQQLQRHIADCGLNDAVEYVGEVDRAGKIRFLQSLDVFSVPTVYRESKGLPVLEAWANRVPVVQPWHGVFPELSNATQGAVLVPPNDPHALADAIGQLFDNEPLRRELGRRGRAAVEQHFTAERMAEATIAVYRAVTSAALPHDG